MNSWEQASFASVEIHNNIGNKSFLVPSYQRGCVWSERQKDQFVDTLKRGLPFGTILLYRDEVKNQYQIIDGFQRCSTILEFINNPARYFDVGDMEEGVSRELANITGISNPNSIVDKIENHLVDWVHSAFSSMDEVRDMQYYDYANAFAAFFPSAKGRESDVVKAVRPTLKKFKDLCENLCTVRIPAIIIKGDDGALPEIFERINSKGTQLSKYQIYAATWTKGYRVISETLQELIQININRYLSMANDGIEISDFDSTTYSRKKELNPFEISYALGKFLGQKYSCLFDIKKEIKDVDSLGFSLVLACIGMKNSNLKNMNNELDRIVGANNIDLFLERIIQCVDTAQKLIGKYNKFKVNSSKEAGPLHTEFQIISLIANIFVVRYASYEKDHNDRVIDFKLSLQSSNQDWTSYEKQLKDHAWKRYCLDIMHARWKGAGDKRLDNVVFDRGYYTQNITWDEFQSSVTQWFNQTKAEKREHKRVGPPQEAEKIFFALLYLPIFTAGDQADQSRYDVEHLATKNLMKKCLDRYDGNLRLPIGSVGNLCLLPQRENRAKKDKTIYGDSSFLQKSEYCLADLEEKFTFTTEKDLAWIDEPTLDQDMFEKKYLHYIDTRFNVMMDKIKDNFKNHQL